MKIAKEILKWINENGLSIVFSPRYNASLYCRLRCVYGELWVSDGDFLKGEVGDGTTLQEAFEDMIKNYNGKTLICQYSVEGRAMKTQFQFPLVIFEGEN